MTFQPGHPKWGGRKKGSLNKPNQERLAMEQEIATRIAEKPGDRAGPGLEPLDYMLLLMRDQKVNEQLRFAAARAAAQYRHPALSAVAVQQVGADGKPIAPQVNINIVSADEVKPALTETKLIDAKPSGTSH